MPSVTKLRQIQLVYNPEKTVVGLLTGDHTYSWPVAVVPKLSTALRACAAGEAEPSGCDGMVYAKGNKVCITDETASIFVVADLDAGENVGWAYAMPWRDALRMAGALEETLRKMAA